MRVSEVPILRCEECGSDEMVKMVPNEMNFKLIGEAWGNSNYEYEYTKCKASTDDKVKPVYSKKEAKAALKKYKDNTFAGMKTEKI
jgi:hypothetical protein